MISDNESISEITSLILTKNLPDKDIELFWYSFKESIYNIIKHNIDISNANENANNTDKYNNIIFELKGKSQFYNKLQKEFKFQEIMLDIKEYIKDISRNFFIQKSDNYNFNIYLTNVKRVSKILDIPDKIKFDWLENYKEDDLFMIFFYIRKYISDHEDSSEQRELYDKINKYTIKYDNNLPNLNKHYLDIIYNLLLKHNYIKPGLLCRFVKYYPVIKDLQKYGFIDKTINIPESWTFEKVFKKGIIKNK
jgi:hypothetical protein